jgi:hypothetical protein
MNYLYISPEFPPNYSNFCIQLSQAGVNVYGIGEASFEELPAHLQGSLRWYLRCPGLWDLDRFGHSLDELVGILDRHGWGGIDLVESHNEFWMANEAYANERLGLPGIVPSDMPMRKKKSIMRKVFRERGLTVAAGQAVRSVAESLEFVARVGYPLILKPDEGVGAVGVFKVHDEAELRQRLSEASHPYVLEKFIDAEMVTYDGLADWDGKVVFANSLTYGCGVLESLLGRDTFFYTHRVIPDGFDALGRDLVRAFGIRRKFFHFEFFKVDGTYLPVEVNARPPGGAIVDMMNYSVDADLYRCYAQMIAQGPSAGVVVNLEKKYFCGYAGRKDKPYAHSHEAILRLLGESIVEHQENPALFWDGMGRYRYIFRATSEQAILQMRDLILETA